MSNLRNFLIARKKEVVFGVTIFLVASLSFGLGYLVRRDTGRAPIVIERCSNSASE